MSLVKRFVTTCGLAAALTLMAGCSVKAPSIAHVHVGHTLTSWIETPNQEGILITAEREAAAVAGAVDSLQSSAGDLSAMKSAARDLVEKLLPSKPTFRESARVISGLIPSTEESLRHVEFAAASQDASANVRASVPAILKGGREMIAAMEQMKVLAVAIAESGSTAESSALTDEIAATANGILKGSSSQTYNIVRLRSDIEAMVAREDPPYTTADSWYLLNLIRLPSGDWQFRSSRDGSGSGGRY